MPPVGGSFQNSIPPYQSGYQIRSFSSPRIVPQPQTNFGYNKPKPPSQNSLLKALDKNKDGEISKKELSLAIESLAKLDADKDGKLSKTEIFPEPYHVIKSREVRQRATRIANRKLSPKEEYVNLEVARVMRFDKNKDGLVSSFEFPQRMQTFLIREDSNGDDMIDLTEANAVANRRWQGLSSPASQRATARSKTQKRVTQSLPQQLQQ